MHEMVTETENKCLTNAARSHLMTQRLVKNFRVMSANLGGMEGCISPII